MNDSTLIDRRMEIEEIAFGWLPIFCCLALMAWSIQLTRNKIKIWKVFFTVLIFIALAFSALILIAILRGAWPTLIPYIVIGFVAIILTIQQSLTSFSDRRSIQSGDGQ